MPAAEDAYTHGHHESVLRSHRWRTAANSAAYLLPHLAPGTDLLDVGCGPGTLTVDLATHVAPGLVVGLDRSAEVVAEARAHATAVRTRGGPAPEVRFVAGDLDGVAGGGHPAGGGFDVVHAHQVLQHLPDPAGALRAMAAAARPGGLVAARDADYGSMTWYPADERLDRWLDLVRTVTRHNRGEADAGRHLPAWARAAGLHDAAYTTSTWTFRTPGERSWWGDLWAERVTRSKLGHQARDLGLATQDELEQIATAWRAWASHPDALFVVLHGEILARA